MKQANRIEIAPDRYRWAVTRAGTTVDDFARSHPSSDLLLWIEGEKKPTERQLAEFAKQVHVPMGFLFMQQPPREEMPIPMFRGTAGHGTEFDLNVYDTILAVSERQEWLEEYLQENDVDGSPLVGIADGRTPIGEIVRRLRALLGLPPEWAMKEKDVPTAINRLTERLEAVGVFTMYNGIVGNNTHRPISVDQCRGFALVNNAAPCIFVNNADSKTAQMFTLVHEAAHLMLGVSAGHAGEVVAEDDHTETVCDGVAAEFLVPATLLREIWTGDIAAAARRFKVSEVVVARRAHDVGLLSDADYRRFWQEYRQRPQHKTAKGDGGDFYRTSVKRIGRLFAIHVRNAVATRQLSYTDAFRLTGLNGNTFKYFMSNSI